RLTSLEIDSSTVPPEWLRVFGAAPGLAGLTRLGVRRADLTPVAARALTEGFWRPDLRALDLGKNGGGGRAAVRELAAAGAFDRLRSLALDECGLNDTSARLLAPRVGRLAELDVRGNYLRDGAAVALAAAPFPADLAAVAVGVNRLTDVGTEALRRRFTDRVVFRE
ncbi:MAG: hypothetical protein ACRC7O_10810, partial [Fimbriiglobus sp.]